MRVQCYVLGDFEANCYLVWSVATRQAVVIDPGGEVTGILREIERQGLALTAILNTHGHADHILGNGELAKATGAPVCIGIEDAPMLTEAAANLSLWFGRAVTGPPPARMLRHGDTLLAGDLSFSIRGTPGHTRGGITLVGEGLAFTGDTLFAGGIGRTDLPGGDETTLLASIERELLSLADETKVYPGHGEATTIGAERAGNPFLSD